MMTDRSGLVKLTDDDCFHLIRTRLPRLGRVGFVHEGRMHVLPVNYIVDGTDIVYRTDEDTALAEAANGTVAFEVDEVDALWQEGWSVLIKGRASVVDDADDLTRLRRMPLHPWVPSDTPSFVRIVPEEITGRRIL